MNRRPKKVVCIEIGDGMSPVVMTSRTWGLRRMRTVVKQIARDHGFVQFAIVAYNERKCAEQRPLK